MRTSFTAFNHATTLLKNTAMEEKMLRAKQVGCIPCTANTNGESKKHAVGVIGENDEILMVRETHPTENSCLQTKMIYT